MAGESKFTIIDWFIDNVQAPNKYNASLSVWTSEGKVTDAIKELPDNEGKIKTFLNRNRDYFDIASKETGQTLRSQIDVENDSWLDDAQRAIDDAKDVADLETYKMHDLEPVKAEYRLNTYEQILKLLKDKKEELQKEEKKQQTVDREKEEKENNKAIFDAARKIVQSANISFEEQRKIDELRSQITDRELSKRLKEEITTAELRGQKKLESQIEAFERKIDSANTLQQLQKLQTEFVPSFALEDKLDKKIKSMGG